MINRNRYTSDIWVGSNCPIRFNGNEWQGYSQDNGWENGWNFSGYINAIWGTSSSNIYFVGDKGTIVHYDGSKFTKMNSGTDIDLRDIAGIGENVFVVGNGDGPESILLELKNGKWNTLLESDSYLGNIEHGDYGFISAVDVLGNTAYIVTEQGLIMYNYNRNYMSIDYRIHIEMQYDGYLAVTVQNTNDVFLFGANGNTLHYNGISWYRDKQINLPDIVFYKGDGCLKNNVAIMVGTLIHGGAIIAKGRRY
jgi:hypothetical protein